LFTNNIVNSQIAESLLLGRLFTVLGDLKTELYPQPISIQQFSYS